MKTKLLILIVCCFGIRANPVDNTKLSNKKPETQSVTNKGGTILKDEDFPPLPDPEKSHPAPIQRTNSVKDLVNFWEQKSADDSNSRPSSPVLGRRPSISSQDKDKKPVETVAAVRDEPEITPAASKPVAPKVVAAKPKIPSDDSPSIIGEKQAVVLPIPKADSADGGVQKSQLTINLKPAADPTPVAPAATRTKESPGGSTDQKKAEQKPISDAFDDVIVTDLDDLKAKPDVPKSVIPIRPIQRQPAAAKTEVKALSDTETKGSEEAGKVSLQRRPSLPKEVQDELIATVAKKEAEKAAADETAKNQPGKKNDEKKGAAAVLPHADSEEAGKTSLQRRPSLPKEVQDELIATVAKKEADKAAAKPEILPSPSKAAADPVLDTKTEKDDVAVNTDVKANKPSPAVNPALKSTSSSNTPKATEETKKEKEVQPSAPVQASSDSNTKAAGDKSTKAAVKAGSASDDALPAATPSNKRGENPKVKSSSKPAADSNGGKASTEDKSKPSAETKISDDSGDKVEEKKEGGFFKKIFG